MLAPDDRSVLLDLLRPPPGSSLDVAVATTFTLDLEAALFRLAAGGVSQLLVEGGSEIHGSFLENGLADRLVLYLAPRIVGGSAALPFVGGEGPQWIRDAAMLRSVSFARVGDGWLVDGRLR